MRNRQQIGDGIYRRTADTGILSVGFSGRKSPQCAFAGEVYTRDIEFERLYGIGGINNRHRECATIIGPSSDDIERKCVTAGINNGLLATGRIGGLGLRRVAGNLDWDGTEVVAVDFEDEPVGIQR